MAKIIKRKKRRFTFETFSYLMITVALVSSIFTSLFIVPINAALMIDIQETNIQANDLRNENQKLAIEIQTLQNKDRIYTIAEDAGLEQIQDNIVSVRFGE